MLGGRNMRWSELIEQVAKISGRHHPLLVLPPEIASGAQLLSRVHLPGLPLEGIRLMAEQGQKTQLLAEIAPAITNGSAQLQLSGGGIRPSPGTVTYVFPEAMRRDFPLVTLVSMVAPSPDWFVGVDSLNLLQGGQWVTNLVVPLYAIDAGTDSGVTYESPDQPSVPRGVLTQHAGFPALQNGVIVPFGSFTFTRLD